MKRIKGALLVMAFLILTCCSDRKAGDLFETARFEELQKNFSHAEKLYGEILERYPKSEFAQKAKERLEELKKVR
jgi:outer membrane protein assembly factor BamD (BamD/ComL family)